jgi:hypothetical protein
MGVLGKKARKFWRLYAKKGVPGVPGTQKASIYMCM